MHFCILLKVREDDLARASHVLSQHFDIIDGESGEELELHGPSPATEGKSLMIALQETRQPFHQSTLVIAIPKGCLCHHYQCIVDNPTCRRSSASQRLAAAAHITD